jgi:hypothetical protein
MAAITLDEVRAAVDYDPETGEFTWRDRLPSDFKSAQGFSAWRRLCKPGDKAGCACPPYRYVRLCIGSNNHLGHRLAWLHHYGTWPTGVIDHINGDGSDNRIVNLRDIPARDNQRNMKVCRRNNSGVSGVRYVDRYRCWRAAISQYGKSISLGSFQTKDAAVAARKQAERELGYHPNHGRAA